MTRNALADKAFTTLSSPDQTIASQSSWLLYFLAQTADELSIICSSDLDIRLLKG